MKIEATNPAGSSHGPYQEPAGSSNRPSFQQLLGELGDYTSIGQGMFNMILAQLGISPEKYKQMTGKERAEIDKKIQELMKKDEQARLDQQREKVQQHSVQQSGPSSDASSSRARHKSIDTVI